MFEVSDLVAKANELSKVEEDNGDEFIQEIKAKCEELKDEMV